MKKKIILSSLTLAGLGWLAISDYFFKYAMTTYKKKPESKELSGRDALYRDKLGFKEFEKQEWILRVDSNISLYANYLDNHSKKTTILLHGFMSDGDSMAGFAKMFYDLGYNVLLPDARAHGRSSGEYIGYGWVEKDDILRWIKKAIGYTGDDTQIVVMGQSMGGATAMMVSGLKLPKQVKAFIEDCGYSSVKEEVDYQASNLFGLPKVIRKPLIKTMSGINRIENGFFLKRASSVKQLRKNTRPFLFIHGGKDHFVPTEMVYQNYAATNAPKFLWVAPLAGHALSYPMYKNKYRQVIKAFLKKYIH